MSSIVMTAALLHTAPCTAEPPPAEFLQQLRAGVPCVAPLQLSGPEQRQQVPAALAAAQFVYVRSPPAAPSLAPRYRGPYEVVWRSSKYFVIKLGNRFNAVTIDRLKPHLGSLVVPEAPPRRGRPPGRP
jgi:hypothetical protein